MKTISITSYKVLSPKLAKIVASYTGDYNADDFRASIASKLKHGASVIDGTFRQVTAGVAVGFVTRNTPTRHVTDVELKAYRQVSASANVYMDAEDKSLWSVKQGAGGTFLTRQGNEDLSELLTASVYHGRPDVPKVTQMTAGAANVNEFVAFVDVHGKAHHGFVTASNATECEVVTEEGVKEVNMDLVTAICSIQIPNTIHATVMQALTDKRKVVTASGLTPEQKATAKEYWKTLFDFAPDYAAQLVRDVDAGTLA